jgi:hypothetical protein
VSSPQLDGLRAIIRFRDDGHVGLSSDHRPEALEDDGVIIGEKHTNYAGSGGSHECRVLGIGHDLFL